jgi:hypothetical protein
MKKITTILVLLALLIVPFTFAREIPVNSIGSGGYDFIDYYLLMKKCTKSGGTWVFDEWTGEPPIPKYYGHCEYPQPEVNPPVGGSNSNPWISKYCNIDRKSICRIRLKIGNSMKFISDDEEYEITYTNKVMGKWYNKIFRPWKTRYPEISIKKGINSYFNGEPKEGEILIDGIEVKDVKATGVFLWIRLEK